MTLDQNTHQKIYIEILKDIYADTTLAPLLGFKGGTAAYLFYDLSRFSVDLDFDLLEKDKEEYILEKIKNIIAPYGEIKDARIKRYNIFFLLSYRVGTQNLKIEINRRFLGAKYELQNTRGISMLVMSKEDMFANKLIAMKERLGRTNRDIFDVWYFFKNNWPLNRELLEKRSGLDMASFLKICIDGLEKLGDQFILSGMGELLTEKQKAWAKANLRKDTIFLLKLALENEKDKK
jgi:hypothetical protein